jgi:type IV pilus assembly protein PilO
MAGPNLGALGKLPWYYQIFIVAAICGVLLGLVWNQYLSPMQEQIVAKQQNLNELNLQVARSQQQKLIFEQFQAQTVELGRKLNDLKHILPLEKETSLIIDSFYKEASNSSVRILRLTLRPVVDHDVYTEWPWDMEVVGTYNNVSLFLDKVRLLPRIVNVSGLRVTSRAPTGEKASTESVGATYTATTFIYHPEEPDDQAAPAAKTVN